MAAETPWKTISGSDLGWNNGGSIGSGYLKARYRRTADSLVFVNLIMLAAADTTFGTPGNQWTWYLPNELVDFLVDVAGVSLHYPTGIGKARAYDLSAAQPYQGLCYAYYQSAQWFLTCEFGATLAAIGAGVPFTWANGDYLGATLIVEGLAN